MAKLQNMSELVLRKPKKVQFWEIALIVSNAKLHIFMVFHILTQTEMEEDLPNLLIRLCKNKVKDVSASMGSHIVVSII